MEKPILVEKKKVVKIGNSGGIILPSWWLKDGTKTVEMEVYADRIILKKVVRREEAGRRWASLQRSAKNME